jgi:hypothetical protein
MTPFVTKQRDLGPLRRRQPPSSPPLPGAPNKPLPAVRLRPEGRRPYLRRPNLGQAAALGTAGARDVPAPSRGLTWASMPRSYHGVIPNSLNKFLAEAA